MAAMRADLALRTEAAKSAGPWLAGVQLGTLQEEVAELQLDLQVRQTNDLISCPCVISALCCKTLSRMQLTAGSTLPLKAYVWHLVLCRACSMSLMRSMAQSGSQRATKNVSAS